MAKGFDWASHLDGVARAALRRLVPSTSVVAATGAWGRRDGCQGSQLVLYVSSHPAHLPIVMDELKAVLPAVHFAVDNPAPLMRAHLLDARHLWGNAPLPPPPVGDTFAAEWAPVQAIVRDSMRATAPVAALDDWQTLRAICTIGCVELPGVFDAPQWVQDLYVARNMGLQQLPDGLQVFVAAALRAWLLG
jgi:hypothetical protein